jgi:hypothetical protein
MFNASFRNAGNETSPLLRGWSDFTAYDGSSKREMIGNSAGGEGGQAVAQG